MTAATPRPFSREAQPSAIQMARPAIEPELKRLVQVNAKESVKICVICGYRSSVRSVTDENPILIVCADDKRAIRRLNRFSKIKIRIRTGGCKFRV
jgi:hypothetical protein